MKLIVTVRELRYGGRNYFEGQSFEASDRDGKILKAIRKAVDPTPHNKVVSEAPVRQVASTRPVYKSPPAVAEAGDKPPIPAVAETPPSSTYRTRRLTAED